MLLESLNKLTMTFLVIYFAVEFQLQAYMLKHSVTTHEYLYKGDVTIK